MEITDFIALVMIVLLPVFVLIGAFIFSAEISVVVKKNWPPVYS